MFRTGGFWRLLVCKFFRFGVQYSAVALRWRVGELAGFWPLYIYICIYIYIHTHTYIYLIACFSGSVIEDESAWTCICGQARASPSSK